MRRILIGALVLVALLVLAQVRLDKGEPLPAPREPVKPILVYYGR
jgi:hypothetical protein